MRSLHGVVTLLDALRIYSIARLMTTFVTADGRIEDVDAARLKQYSLDNKLIARPGNFSNDQRHKELLDPTSGKKQLNLYVGRAYWQAAVDSTG